MTASFPRRSGGPRAAPAVQQGSPQGGAHTVLPSRVNDDSRLADADLRVLLALSSLLDRHGEASRASVNQMIQVTGLARATIYRALKTLESSGWVRREARYHPYSGATLSNAYIVNFRNEIPAEHDRLAEFTAMRGQKNRPPLPMHSHHETALSQDKVVTPVSLPGLSSETGVMTPESPPGPHWETGGMTPESPPGLPRETGPVSPVRPLNMDIISIKTSNQDSMALGSMALGAQAISNADSAQVATAEQGPAPRAEGQGVHQEVDSGDHSRRPDQDDWPDDFAIASFEKLTAFVAKLARQVLADVALFERLRSENFPNTAPASAPPGAAEEIIGWYAYGASPVQVSDVMRWQMDRLVARGKEFPRAPNAFSSDIRSRIDQDRQIATSAGQPAIGQGLRRVGVQARQAFELTPWQALDRKLRERLGQTHRDTTRLHEIRSRATNLKYEPQGVEELFDRLDAWSDADPVGIVIAHLLKERHSA
jgi:hypothetical protein